MKQMLRIFRIGILTILLLGLVGFLVWAQIPYKPEKTAIKSITPSETKNNNEWLMSNPDETILSWGLALYPSTLVGY